MTEKQSLEGIGGWLILVAIGIIVTPIRIVWLLMTVYPEMFSLGVWEALTSQGSELYDPLWAPIIIAELLINCGLLVVSLYLAYKFFTKSKDFPKWFIGIAIFSLVWIIADAFAIKLVLPSEPIFDSETTQQLIRALIQVLIWVPYMLVSQRVKATFIK